MVEQNDEESVSPVSNEPSEDEKLALRFVALATSEHANNPNLSPKFYMGIGKYLEKMDGSEILKFVEETAPFAFRDFKENYDEKTISGSSEVQALKSKLDDLMSAKADTDKILSFLSIISKKAIECTQLSSGAYTIFEGEVLKTISELQKVNEGPTTNLTSFPGDDRKSAFNNQNVVRFPKRSIAGEIVDASKHIKYTYKNDLGRELEMYDSQPRDWDYLNNEDNEHGPLRSYGVESDERQPSRSSFTHQSKYSQACLPATIGNRHGNNHYQSTLRGRGRGTGRVDFSNSRSNQCNIRSQFNEFQ